MSYRPLKGQTALVTGASSGIGLGLAKALGAAGPTWWSTTSRPPRPRSGCGTLEVLRVLAR